MGRDFVKVRFDYENVGPAALRCSDRYVKIHKEKEGAAVGDYSHIWNLVCYKSIYSYNLVNSPDNLVVSCIWKSSFS